MPGPVGDSYPGLRDLVSCRRRALCDYNELAVTPQMIDAGVDAAREHQLGEPLSDLVYKIFVAMASEALALTQVDPPPQASHLDTVR